jgi:pSer/pThr/pTyr-binding forkhead associated (FHA) protein
MSSNTGGTRYLHVHLPSGAEYTVALTGDDVTIGKSEKNAIVVDDPAVSSTHALLRCSNGEWLVADLGSRNGVFVNHHRITGSCVLRPGDVIAIGHCRLSIRAKPESGARKEKEKEKDGGKDRKRSVQQRATYIKVSGALLAKIIGPIATLLLGLLLSGRYMMSCGAPAPSPTGGTPPPASRNAH